MRDYYAVLARAVSGLDSNTPGARKAVFSRARTILIDHLRRRQPSASNSEIIRECAALDDAVRKIESEMTMAKGQNLTRGMRQEPKKSAPSDDPARPTMPTKAAHSFKSRHTVSVAQRSTRALDGFFKKSPVMLASRLLDRLAIKNTKQHVNSTAALRSNAGPAATTMADKTKRGAITVSNHRDSTDKAMANVEIPIFKHLLGIKWLDQLMLDAAVPTAPDSLQADARTVLKWLGVDTPAALDIEHYDRFTRAFQRYIMECQNPSLGPLTATCDSSLLLNDDIRATFSRLLEREQTARVFDKALLWVANVWIKMVLILNLVAVIGLVGTAPNLWIGAIRLSQAYSLFNVWNWAAQIVALAPALLAMVWLHRRLTSSRIAAVTTFAKSMTRSLTLTAVSGAVNSDPRFRKRSSEHPAATKALWSNSKKRL
jgi:hypothetical protein